MANKFCFSAPSVVALLVAMVVLSISQVAFSVDRFVREGSRGQLVFAHSSGDDVILSNNMLDLQIGRRGSVVNSLVYKRDRMPDVQLLDNRGKSLPGYWDIHWENSTLVQSAHSASREKNAKCKFGGSRGASWINLDGGRPGDEMLGVTFKPQTMRPGNEGRQPLKTTLHYAMREDLAGAYCTLQVEHNPEHPNVLLTELRLVLRLNPSLFDYSYVADERQRFMPSRSDISGKSSSQLAFKEARLITRPHNEEFLKMVDHKYQFSVESKDSKLYGWISSKLRIGVWIIAPNKWEYMGGGPFKQDLSVQTGPNLLAMLHSRHYGTPAIEINKNEQWKKEYGPFLIYVNEARDIDDLILDAKARAAEEARAWPYKWVPKQAGYPKRDERGAITGRVMKRDPFNAHDDEGEVSKTAPGTWVGLTDASASTSNWEDEVKKYQYWNVTNESGEFTIHNVRPGTYILQTILPGTLVDSSVLQTVAVAANWVSNVGEVELRSRQKGPTVWEIGVPDRSAGEFMIPGKNDNSVDGTLPLHRSSHLVRQKLDAFRQYGLWEKFAALFPDGEPVFTIGKSDWSKDWFFAHVIRPHNGTTQREIVFEIEQVIEGDYTLRLAIAGAHQASIEVRLNSPEGAPLHDTGAFGRDNALARGGIHGHYHEFSISLSHMNLRVGKNSLFLHQRKRVNDLSYVMYDYIRLEAPATSIRR